MSPDPGDYRYPTPTASPFDDIDQYVPLLLAAVDVYLDQASVWPEGEEDEAQGYMEDLKAWLQEISKTMFTPIGGTIMYAGSSSPLGWLPCDGDSYNAADYPDLFAAIGYTFGGSGATFNVPDMRGRAAIGVGTGSGLTERDLNDAGGAESHQLITSELPDIIVPGQANSIAGTGRFMRGANGTGTNSSVTVTSSGESAPLGQAHENMPPFRALNFLIRAK